MKVLFLTPQLGSWATHGHHVAPNQMHAQWAAYAREKGTIQPEVLDCKALEIPFDAMLNLVKAKNPEVVVLGDILHSYGGFAVQKYFNDTAQAVKKILPKTKIVVGGGCGIPFLARKHSKSILLLISLLWGKANLPLMI